MAKKVKKPKNPIDGRVRVIDTLRRITNPPEPGSGVMVERVRIFNPVESVKKFLAGE